MRTVILLAAAGLVAGCAGETRVESSTPDVVTVSYFEGNAGAAESKARDECSRYGKRTRLRNTSSSGTGERLGIYECLP